MLPSNVDEELKPGNSDGSAVKTFLIHGIHGLVLPGVGRKLNETAPTSGSVVSPLADKGAKTVAGSEPTLEITQWGE
jgi:hypothetical protein